jgi:hypothetical protein
MSHPVVIAITALGETGGLTTLREGTLAVAAWRVAWLFTAVAFEKIRKHSPIVYPRTGGLRRRKARSCAPCVQI